MPFDVNSYNIFILNNNKSSLILRQKNGEVTFMLNIDSKKLDFNFMNNQEFKFFLDRLSKKNNIKKIVL